MASSIASLVLRRAICRGLPSISSICKPRCFSSLISSSYAPRVLTSRTLTRPCPAIAIRSVVTSTSKAMTQEEKVKRADENLLRVLDSEIECAEDSDDEAPPQEVALPGDFPFEIVDNTGEQSIILKRKFQGENIEVSVYMDEDEDEPEPADEDDEDEDDEDKDADGTLTLVPKISKKGAGTLEFSCSLNSEGLEIENITVKKAGVVDNDEEAYDGPHFTDLDESLQKALRKYLIVRGIKPTLYDFLRDYMMNKDEKEYKTWLQNLKGFVEK